MAKILIVGQTMVIVHPLRRIFEKEGYEVMLAVDGREALRTLSKHQDTDIVITDYALPDMNGIELGKKIQEDYDAHTVLFLKSFTDVIRDAHGISMSAIESQCIDSENRLKGAVAMLLGA